MAHDRADSSLGPRGLEALDVLRRMVGRPPGPRALGEDLHGLGAPLHRTVDRRVDSSSGGDVGPGQHGTTITACPCASALRPARPASSTSEAFAPPSSTGSSRATRAASSCFASRTPTRAGRSRSRSSKSSGHSAGWASTGTGRSSSSSTRSRATQKPRACCSPRATPTKRRAPSAFACRTRARPSGRTRSRDGSPTPTRSSRTSCSCAQTGGLPTTWRRQSTTPTRRITHVIRGEDHVPNTPKQIRILEALGRPVPVYAHVPNVFGTDGRKLSKRHGAVSVEEFRAQGYLASALMNYLALLGWSYDDRTTVMSRDELVERFSLDRVGSSPATFDYAKLDWLNGVYLRELPPEEFADTLVAYLRGAGLRGRRGDDPRFGAARPGEDLATRGVSGLRGLLLPPRAAACRAARRRRAGPGRGEGDPRRRRAFRRGADRGGAARDGGEAGTEAA